MNTINKNTSTTELSQWSALPAPGHRCPVSGLTRSRLYQLLQTSHGAIRQVSLKEPGRAHGTRLVHVPSLLEYLDGLATSQARQIAQGEVK